MSCCKTNHIVLIDIGQGPAIMQDRSKLGDIQQVSI